VGMNYGPHKDIPAQTGWAKCKRATIITHGIIVEPNTDFSGATGSKMTELRVTDINGKFIKMVEDAYRDKVHGANFKEWYKAIDKKVNGEKLYDDA